MKLKKLMMASALAFGVSMTPAHAGGIPVIDTASIAKYIEQIATMKEQIENQVAQIVELKNQVQAVTGGRAMGDLLRDAAGSVIPDEWKQIYGDLNRISNGRLNEKYDPNQSNQGLLVMLDNTEKVFGEIKDRVSKIEQLTTTINTTTDIKASQDLQARITAEQLAISNQQVKLDQMQRMYELEKELQTVKYNNDQSCNSLKFAYGSNYQCN